MCLYTNYNWNLSLSLSLRIRCTITKIIKKKNNTNTNKKINTKHLNAYIKNLSKFIFAFRTIIPNYNYNRSTIVNPDTSPYLKRKPVHTIYPILLLPSSISPPTPPEPLEHAIHPQPNTRPTFIVRETFIVRL